jgi:hypothetical protein
LPRLLKEGIGTRVDYFRGRPRLANTGPRESAEHLSRLASFSASLRSGPGGSKRALQSVRGTEFLIDAVWRPLCFVHIRFASSCHVMQKASKDAGLKQTYAKAALFPIAHRFYDIRPDPLNGSSVRQLQTLLTRSLLTAI